MPAHRAGINILDTRLSMIDFLARLRERRERARRSIYEHIRGHVPATGSGLTADGETLPDEPDLAGPFRWASGAADGISTHHMGTSDDRATVDETLRLLDRAAVEGGESVPELEQWLIEIQPISIVDPLLTRLRGRGRPSRGMEVVARYLARKSGSRNAVKVGIALLGLFPGRNRDILLTLGRHDEFTLYCAVALSNTVVDPDDAVWELARNTKGWGRIHAVERLKDTTRLDIQDWILRRGFRNTILDEYLAFIAATTGGLIRALEVEAPDAEIIDASCQIISALIAGGPAEGIDQYKDGARAMDLLTAHLQRGASTLYHFIVVHRFDRFVADEHEKWPTRVEDGWTPELRDRVRARCREIAVRPEWRQLASEGLRSADPREFERAVQACRILGIDTFDAHVTRIRADPIKGNWYALMEIADDRRIGEIVELAIRLLPLSEIASGLSDELGLGPEFRAHRALGFVVQGLKRFPGQGWPLVVTSLRSPVLENRNMALNLIEIWGSAAPAEARALLVDLIETEPDDHVRKRMQELLESRTET
jgi:hypothetical protein